MADLQEIYIAKKFKQVNPPINISISSTSTRIYRHLLLDISRNKKWISFITESYDKVENEHDMEKQSYDEDENSVEEQSYNKKKNNVKIYLTVHIFKEVEQQPSTTSFHISIDITELDSFQDNEHLRFLSISPDGKKILLSRFGGIVKRNSNSNYGCIVLEISANDVHSVKFIKHSGRGLFFNDKLMISNNIYVTVLDSEYKEMDKISLREVNHDESALLYTNYTDINTKPTWIYRDHNCHVYFDPYKLLFLQYGMIVSVINGKATLWSIKSRCHLISVPSSECFVGYLESNQWCVTYNDKARKFRITEIKSGSSVITLESQLLGAERFTVSDTQLANQGKYLIISGTCMKRGEYNVWYEAWSIVSGFSVGGATFKEHSYGELTINPTVWEVDSTDCIFEESAKTDNTCIEKPEIENSNNSSSFETSNMSENIGDSISFDIVESEGSEDNDDANNSIKSSTKSTEFTFDYSLGMTFSFPKIMGLFADKENNGIRLQQVELDLFKKKTIEKYDRIFFEDSSHLQVEEDQPYDSGWQLFPQIGGGLSHIRYFQNKIHCVICKGEYVQVWRLPPYSIDYQHLEVYGMEYFEQLLSHNGQLLLLCPLKDPDNAEYNAKAKKVTFVQSPGFCERLVVMVKLEDFDMRTSYYRVEEYCLPLFPMDTTKSTMYYNYAFRNAFNALFNSPKCYEAHGFKRNNNDKYADLARSHVFGMLNKMKQHSSDYFTTLYGSQTLVLSTSANYLHDILYHILKDGRLSINRLSDMSTISATQPILYTVNTLLELVYKKKIDLFNLLLNRLLLSKPHNTGSFSSITETLLCLQDDDQCELLLATCKKLSFINTVKDKLPSALNFELESLNNLQNIQSLDSFSSQEQLYHYKTTRYEHLTDKLAIIRQKFLTPVHTIKYKISHSSLAEWVLQDYQKYNPAIPKRYLTVCAVPLIHFNSYHISPASGYHEDNDSNKSETLKESTFIRTATMINNSNIFNEGDLIFEIMLKHKWKQFAKSRFVIVCSIYVVFYISYTVGVSFAAKVFDYTPESQITHSGQIACICLMFTSGFILLLQEFHQLIKSYSKIHYLLSPYNWLDLASLILPTIMFVSLYQGKSNFNNINGFTALVLWLQGILKLRVWRYVGVTLETIIQLILEVKEILLIFFLIVCAFTNAFIVILMDKQDDYFQEQYTGSNADSNFNDASSSNPFTDVYKSFATLWFFIYGVWDPVNDGDVGDNRTIMVLSIMFSLITILIFFNLIIVYMSGKVEEIRQKGKKAWTRHFASVVAEIEQLWCFPHERRDRNNHPSYIYYYAHINDINKHEISLEEEIQEIIKRLDRIYGEEPRIQQQISKHYLDMKKTS